VFEPLLDKQIGAGTIVVGHGTADGDDGEDPDTDDGGGEDDGDDDDSDSDDADSNDDDDDDGDDDGNDDVVDIFKKSHHPVPKPTKAKKVPCKVSAWSAWTKCSATCGGGSKSRARTVKVPAANGGKACPVLSNSKKCGTDKCKCKVSAWSAWGHCNANCAGGTRTRTRSVKSTGPGAKCPVLSKSEKCNTQKCRPGQVTGLASSSSGIFLFPHIPIFVPPINLVPKLIDPVIKVPTAVASGNPEDEPLHHCRMRKSCKAGQKWSQVKCGCVKA